MHEHPNPVPYERAILIGIDRSGQHGSLADRLEELALLADTARCEPVGTLTQARHRPDPRTYLGKGKVAELKELAAELEADVVIVDTELSPAQARNLEAALERSVVDRTQLILDIFARRAQTRLARWEVELAQLQYDLPRFKRMWTHLSRLDGGGVGTRGPGETQLEEDRRAARARIHLIQERLAEAERQKEVAGAARQGAFAVALVGYTNVGKSTLMRALTGAEVFVEDRLFATLDATTRRLAIDGSDLLLTDTVGFIRDLPHTLVASFHATLAEVLEADLLLHVADVASPELGEQIDSVRAVLQEIGAAERPTLMVFNKVDRLPSEADAAAIAARFGDGVLVSAQTGTGLDDLQAALLAALRARHQHVRLAIPYREGRVTAYLEANAKILHREFTPTGTEIEALVDPADVGRVRDWIVEEL
ncbi:MAG: GTPase HflX [Fimbriimonadaceae bacterium]|nr:GTPase HflX [Fimbriimonadaceae bacterium]